MCHHPPGVYDLGGELVHPSLPAPPPPPQARFPLPDTAVYCCFLQEVFLRITKSENGGVIIQVFAWQYLGKIPIDF